MPIKYILIPSVLKSLVPQKRIFFWLLALVSVALYSQAPANDNFVSATGLAINGCSADAAFTTLNATADGITGSCWPSGPNANVWFSFVATATGTVQVNLDRGNISGDMTGDMRYAMMSLWDATGTTEIACSSYLNASSDISILANGLVNGFTYLISVDRRYPTPSAAESFKLCLSDTPTYDYMQGAINIDGFMNGCSGDAIFSTLGATPDRNGASCWPNVLGPGPYRNVWFAVTATATGAIEVKLDRGGTKGALQTAMLALWEADGTTEVACNSYRIGNDYDDVSLLGTGLTPGSMYYVSVDNTYIHALDTFSLCLSDQATNDYYEGATDVTGLIGTCSGDEAYTTLGNTFDRTTGSCWLDIVNHNTWFRFDAPASGRIQIDLDRGGTQGTLRHAYMSLWSTDGTTELACTTYSDPEDDLRIRHWNLTPGTTYYISVDNRYITTTETFVLCLDALNDSDIDGDGVGDIVDFDDDNDGILDSVEGCQTTDILNTIGIGNNVPNSITYPLIGTDITYTLNNPDNIDIFGYDAGANGHSIRVEANAGDAGSMTATYSTPISGVQFKLSDFDHRTQYTVEIYDQNNTLYNLANEGVVSLGSQITQTGNYFEAQSGDVDGDNPAEDDLGSIIFYFSGQVSRIVLTFNHPVNSSTRFTQPVYCIQDTDNDGIPDFHDLDSDADGIPDNVEAQTTIGYTAPNGTVGVDGIDTAYPTGLAPTNTDGADNPDYLDTNSDNEGAPDAAEAGLTPVNVDVDNDGLDDATDANVSGYADPGGIIGDPLTAPVILPDVDGDANSGGDVDFRDAQDDRPDNDNDGVPDVLDLDDDNDGIRDYDEYKDKLYGAFGWFFNAPAGTLSMDYMDDDETDADYSSTGSGATDWVLASTADAVVSGISYTLVNTDITMNTMNSTTLVQAMANNDYVEFSFVTSDQVAHLQLDNLLSGRNNPSQGDSFYSSMYYSQAAGPMIEISRDVFHTDNGNSRVDYNHLTTGRINLLPETAYAFRLYVYGQIDDSPQDWSNLDDFRFVFHAAREADTDNDGHFNRVDLDSDNDGIFDALEIGHGQPFTNGTVNGPVGTNGLPDSVETAPDSDAINYTLAESGIDLDTILDFLDLDSDGDGLPDNIEAQTTVSYIAPNGAVDANGVDTAYVGGIDPTNTDGTDNLDYLDLDSDNEGDNDAIEAAITLSGNDIDDDGLDDATDAETTGYADPGGTIDNPLSNPLILPDIDNDATSGGDVDFRDAIDYTPVNIDSDNDGILDSIEDLNVDGDNDPATDPTNSDGDTYPDYLDIDSDNDGIPDNIEAQTTAGYIPPSLLDTNANGLDDAYEQGVRMGLIPINTDGEDFPDYLDVDSDNDNVPDAIEGHDHNRDGIADVGFVGSDKDNDGLDDGYEGGVQIDVDVNDEIDNPPNDLPDTDDDGSLDYRDIDDDNDDIPTREEDANNDGNYANDDVDDNGTPDYLEPNYPEVEVFNVVTPNDDGVHDFLIITGLDIRPNNSIKIFNRWGILVYEKESYDSNGNQFDGTSQARATMGKEEKLPAGTYYYMLNYEDVEGGNKTLSGYLYLN